MTTTYATALYTEVTESARLYELSAAIFTAVREGRTSFYMGHGRTIRGQRQMSAAAERIEREARGDF